MTKYIFSALLFCVMVFFTFGCSEYLPEQETISSGEILTPEYMAEISQKLVEEKNTSSEVSNDDSTLKTEDSSVLELDDIQTEYNSVTQAIVTSQQIEGGETPDETTIDVVYWTEGGSVWHNTKDCSALARSKNIISGSVHDAVRAGKERVCKKCG